MSLPREILDQLLSGYLDDALSADERARVEHLLQSDLEIARELQELREVRAALKSVARADSATRLPSGFADRVLDTAIATAQSEGLSDSHPLIKLAEQPISRRAAPATQGASWRVAGVLIALAASIVIAVVALRPENVPGPIDQPGLALNDADSETPDPAAERIVQQSGDPKSGSGLASQERQLADTPVSGGADSAVQGEISDVVEVEAGALPKGSSPTAAVAANETSSDVVIPGAADPGVMTEDRVASGEVGSDRGDAVAAAASGDPGSFSSVPREPPVLTERVPGAIRGTGAIMVLDILRTPLGRQSDVVTSAMRAVGIGAASEKKVTPEMVAVADDVDPSVVDDDAAIYYLQVSAKRLDRLIMTLVADEAGVESVRFMLAEDAPTLLVVESLQPLDPTEVQHAGSWQLTSETESLSGAIASRLSQRSEYLAIDPATASAGAATALAQPQSGGPDVISEMLLLVR